MDSKVLENELKNLKVRQGALYKRSKFLKEWRQRWVVLTMNFLFTFTNKSCKEVTQVIDLKQMKSYKSYLRKDDEMVPSGFKIRSDDNEYYFCGKSANQKWSWIVTLQRLMDYKYTGSSTYNNIDFIKTKGFISQIDFENLKSGDKVAQLPSNKKQQPQKSAQEASKQVDIQVQKILKQLQNQKQQLKIKELEFSEKQKMLKDQQDALRKQQQDNQRLLIKRNEQKIQNSTKSMTIQPAKESPKKEQNTQITRNSVPSGSKVSELKNLFEKKMVQSSKQTAPAYKLGFNQNKNQKAKSKNDQLYSFRSKTVANLFQEFHTESPEPEALKFILDFLVKMASEQIYGYSSSIIAQIKSHNNRNFLAQILMELITDFKDYQNCKLFAKFIEICLVNTSGLFNLNSINIIQNKFNDIFLSIDNQENMQIIMRTMFILNRIQKYQKNSAIKEKLTKLTKDAKRQENKNWSRKLVDQF